jgi:hypothetical protein
VIGRMEIASKLNHGLGPEDLGDVSENGHHRYVVSCTALGVFDRLRIGAHDLASKSVL